jgi:hypothetical protein
MACDYTIMPNGREVIRVFNDGEDPGWFNIENNSKNRYGTINGYMVKLVNMKNPSNFVFLNPFMGESFSFQGEQFIGCEQANKPGVPFDWIRQYNRGEYIFKPIDCSKAGVTISRCYPQGSPGGQGNRSQKLGLVSPKEQPKPTSGQGYAFGVYPSQKTPTTGETKSVVPATQD